MASKAVGVIIKKITTLSPDDESVAIIPKIAAFIVLANLFFSSYIKTGEVYKATKDMLKKSFSYFVNTIGLEIGF
jgi:hypothetical protein